MAALAAGLINALAGGGTLITFPVLMSIGLPAISANVTNTVALSPGYLGGTLAQSQDLQDQRKKLWIVLPAGVLGGLLGGFLLLHTKEKLFTELVPFLILIASTLLAIQNRVRNWITRHQDGAYTKGGSFLILFFTIFLAAIYGGYFGAGLSVIILAFLGLVLNDTLTRMNALKQVIAFATNLAAAFFFVFSEQVVWSVALVMAVGALIGGALGGKLAGRIKASTLRLLVVVIGFCIGIFYLVKNILTV